MNCSAVLVVVRPGRLDGAVEALEALEGVEVHQLDREHSRLICTIEGETEQVEADRFGLVARLEDVLDASLVSHYLDVDDDSTAARPL